MQFLWRCGLNMDRVYLYGFIIVPVIDLADELVMDWQRG